MHLAHGPASVAKTMSSGFSESSCLTQKKTDTPIRLSIQTYRGRHLMLNRPPHGFTVHTRVHIFLHIHTPSEHTNHLKRQGSSELLCWITSIIYRLKKSDVWWVPQFMMGEKEEKEKSQVTGQHIDSQGSLPVDRTEATVSDLVSFCCCDKHRD